MCANGGQCGIGRRIVLAGDGVAAHDAWYVGKRMPRLAVFKALSPVMRWARGPAPARGPDRAGGPADARVQGTSNTGRRVQRIPPEFRVLKSAGGHASPMTRSTLSPVPTGTVNLVMIAVKPERVFG